MKSFKCKYFKIAILLSTLQGRLERQCLEVKILKQQLSWMNQKYIPVKISFVIQCSLEIRYYQIFIKHVFIEQQCYFLSSADAISYEQTMLCYLKDIQENKNKITSLCPLLLLSSLLPFLSYSFPLCPSCLLFSSHLCPFLFLSFLCPMKCPRAQA